VKLRVVIVDDEVQGRRTIRSQCLSAGDIEVVGESASGEEAIALIRRLRPDVAFLDIHMRPISGLQVAASIGDAAMPVVVFVTAYDQYALTAFELNAVDYLLKPFDEARFRRMLDRVRHRVAPAASAEARAKVREGAITAAAQIATRDSPADESPVILEVGGRVHLFRQSDIECVEADGNYLAFWVRGESYSVRGTLAELELQLAPPRFLRVRRSVLVNAAHVSTIKKWAHGEYLLELTSGRRVSTGRTFRHRLRGIVRRSRDTADDD
jgi:two-component system LytT family response regulator